MLEKWRRGKERRRVKGGKRKVKGGGEGWRERGRRREEGWWEGEENNDKMCFNMPTLCRNLDKMMDQLEVENCGKR